MKYNLLELYEKTLKGPWKQTGDGTHYKLIGDEHILCLCFQKSEKEDWKYNLRFWTKPYKNLLTSWYAHSGFVTAWKLAKDQIITDVNANLGNRKLIIMGYSHGASLSVLAHEYFWFYNMNPLTFCFAPARVIWMPFGSIKKRFKNLYVIKNRGDIVTHLAPNLFGYFHVGKKKVYGKSLFISPIPHLDCKYKEVLKDKYLEI